MLITHPIYKLMRSIVYEDRKSNTQATLIMMRLYVKIESDIIGIPVHLLFTIEMYPIRESVKLFVVSILLLDRMHRVISCFSFIQQLLATEEGFLYCCSPIGFF